MLTVALHRWEAFLQTPQAEEREGQGTPRMPHFWPAWRRAEDQLHLTRNQHRLPAQQRGQHRGDSGRVRRREPGRGLPRLVGRDSAAGELSDSLLHRGNGLPAEHALCGHLLLQAGAADLVFRRIGAAGQHPHPPAGSQFVFALQRNSGTPRSSSPVCPRQPSPEFHVRRQRKESRNRVDGVQLGV